MENELLPAERCRIFPWETKENGQDRKDPHDEWIVQVAHNTDGGNTG